MTDLPTLEAAMKLADQDSPLPSLAGPALKVLREHILRVRNEEDYLTRLAKEFGTVKWFERHGVPDTAQDSATLAALIAELRAREALGRRKCGHDVDRTDLTNTQWRQHLREELMDALLYSLAEERTAPVDAIRWSASEAQYAHAIVALRETLEAQDKWISMETTYAVLDAIGIVPSWNDLHATAPADGCWCEVCNPSTFLGWLMVLCPTCGNKRCPHAHDHRNACTHSNAVGQPGSSWEHIKPLAPPAPEDC